jgi:hypothetical protein
MSEDTTQDMSKKYDTKPTFDTLLERVNFLIEQTTTFREEMTVFRQKTTAFQEEMTAFREEVDIRFDRLEGLTNKTYSELKYLSADLKEFKPHFKEPT